MPVESAAEIGIASIACAFGELAVTVEETAARGLLISEAAHFRQAGFVHQRTCLPETSPYDLAKAAVRQIESSLTDVGAILYHSALPINSNLPPAKGYEETRQIRDLTDFPVSHLQTDFGLEQAFTLGITQQACTGLFGAVRVARSLLLAEPELQKILCVSADRVPEGGLRESSYNPLADGAIACLVTRGPSEFRVVAAHQITNGALSLSSADELVGSYFTYTARLIEETLRRAQLSLADIHWIVPQNLASAAWRIMSSLLKFDSARVLFPTMADVGHLVSGCNFANLSRCLSEGVFKPGERILLPIAGYGLNWQCLILERV
jgi:3-oxoacyl-[acyl-carrier-protein] synthase-3